jgi:hypothetical protein
VKAGTQQSGQLSDFVLGDLVLSVCVLVNFFVSWGTLVHRPYIIILLHQPLADVALPLENPHKRLWKRMWKALIRDSRAKARVLVHDAVKL